MKRSIENTSSASITRRNAVKAGVAGIALAGAASASFASAEESATERVWDKETDVVVVGFGGAGSNAAIVAHDAGSEVVIVEKMGQGGGNTTLSLGGWICPTDADATYEYICALFGVSGRRGRPSLRRRGREDERLDARARRLP